jgi:hypothetical protein
MRWGSRAVAIVAALMFMAFPGVARAADSGCPLRFPGSPFRPYPAIDTATPYALGDFDLDGGADVAILYTHQPATCTTNFFGPVTQPTQYRVDVVNGRTRRVLWSIKPGAIADVRPIHLGGGAPGLLVVGGDGPYDLRAYRRLGTAAWQAAGIGRDATILPGPAGKPDFIAVDSSDPLGDHVRGLNAADGSTVYSVDTVAGQVSAIGDITGDGRSDRLVMRTTDTGGVVGAVVNGATGATVWDRTVPNICAWQDHHGGYNLLVNALLTGDQTGDGRSEIAISGPPCPAADTDPSFTALLDGRTGAERWFRAGTAFSGGDASGDGRPETLLARTTFPSNPMTSYTNDFSLVDASNTVVTSVTQTVSWTSGPSYPLQRLRPVGDADGDGAPDLTVVSQVRGVFVVRQVVSGRTLGLIGPDPNPAAEGDPLGASTDGTGTDTTTWLPNGTEPLAVHDLATGTTRWTENRSSYGYNPGFAGPQITTLDANGDGKADLLVHENRNQIVDSTYHALEVVEVLDGSTGARLWKLVVFGP